MAIEPNYCCFNCPQCRTGSSSGCARRTMVGFNHPGLLAERVAVPARFTWPADIGGTVVLLGLGPAPLPVTAAQLVRRQLTVRGSLIYDHPADFPDTIAALARQELDSSQVVQAGFPPDRVAEAFAEALNLPGKPWLDLSPWSVD